MSHVLRGVCDVCHVSTMHTRVLLAEASRLRRHHLLQSHENVASRQSRNAVAGRHCAGCIVRHHRAAIDRALSRQRPAQLVLCLLRVAVLVRKHKRTGGFFVVEWLVVAQTTSLVPGEIMCVLLDMYLLRCSALNSLIVSTVFAWVARQKDPACCSFWPAMIVHRHACSG